MSEHAEFSPSSFHRLQGCSGSWLLEQTIEPLATSIHSAYGTAAHNVAANALVTGLDAEHFIDTEQQVEGFSFVVDKEMAAFIQIYLDAIRTETGADGELHVECRVDFSKTLDVAQSAFGTADAIILKPKRISISDLKFGKGVLVHAKENPQLALYALGALEKFGRDGIKEIAMTIHQPRRNHISQWIATIDEIDAFAIEAKAAVEKALLPDAPLTPGKHCQFCNAKPSCPAVNSQSSNGFAVLSNPFNKEP
jgi:hypothetical protein